MVTDVSKVYKRRTTNLLNDLFYSSGGSLWYIYQQEKK